MIKVIAGFLVVAGAYFGWKLCSRTAYESAAYTVISKDGVFEIRDYPELILASTPMQATSGNDGSFMRLFRYISGGNVANQKIAMTTPVFMDPSGSNNEREMSFVLPKKFNLPEVPEPSQNSVVIARREAGRYGVIRFSGSLTEKTAAAAEDKLRIWLNQSGLKASSDMEMAGYDPPITPGPLRRNEILIRLR